MVITKTDNNITYSRLSIQIHLNGLSFCVLNPIKQEVEYIRSELKAEYYTPETLLDVLQSTIKSEPKLQQSFNTVSLLYQHDLFTIVPQALFNENYLADYLKYNTPLLATDFIAYDSIEIIDSVSVFIPYININNFVFETFGDFNFKHTASILIPLAISLEKNNNKPLLIINTTGHFSEIVVVNNNTLKLYNAFKHESEVDFMYYILFTLEQLKLQVSTIDVKLMGNINKNDILYEICKKNLPNLSFYTTPSPYIINEEPHINALILNSF